MAENPEYYPAQFRQIEEQSDMKKTEWPIRWDLLLRYRLIEIIALWEGRLTTNHICHSFGIGRQQASKDINTYLRELAPGNLIYDRHLKGYVPADHFKPVVTQGHADEYLELVSRHDRLSQAIENLDIGLPDSLVLTRPQPTPRPELVRTIVAATRQGRQLRAVYLSMHTPEPEHCLLEPHSLVYSDQGWYVRGWCHNRQDYRNFLITRFRAPITVLADRINHRQHQDEQWNRLVKVTLRPNQHLSNHQRELIAHDYGMHNERLELRVRSALLPHLLQQLGIGSDQTTQDPLRQPLELVTDDTISALTSQPQDQAAAICH